jgi:hypothetical protein
MMFCVVFWQPCAAGKYLTSTNTATANDVCTNCPVSTWSAAGATTCNICMDAEAAPPTALSWGGNSMTMANYTTTIFGNHVAEGAGTSAASCKNTKSTCPNVPLFAEMIGAPASCVPACTKNTQMRAGTGSGACTACSGTCRMDMTFTAHIYAETEEFSSLETKFKDAVDHVFGAKNPPIEVTSAAAAAHGRKAATVLATVKVSLAAGDGTGTSSNPGLTYKALQDAMIAKLVTTKVPAAHYPFNALLTATTPTVGPFPDTTFLDTGALLDMTVVEYKDVSGDVLTEASATVVELELTFAQELTTDQQVQVRAAVAEVANVLLDNVKMTKASRRASHGGDVKYDVKILTKDKAAADAVVTKVNAADALKNAITAKSGLTVKTVGTAAAVASTANTTSTTNTTSDDSLSAVPGFRPTMPLTCVVSLLAMFSASGVVMS